jgi:hypothetical protein
MPHSTLFKVEFDYLNQGYPNSRPASWICSSRKIILTCLKILSREFIGPLPALGLARTIVFKELLPGNALIKSVKYFQPLSIV